MKKELTRAQIDLLKSPLPPEAVKPHPTKNYLSSIKAIYVVERLNEVFGLGGWFATNEVIKEEGKMIVVKSTFNAPEYGIMIPDIFGGNDNADLGDAYKGACTDALTKIGSYLYIGMDVYKGLNGENKPQAKKETPLKKLISDRQFSQLLEKMKTDKSAADKAEEIFTFTTDQYAQLQQLKKTA